MSLLLDALKQAEKLKNAENNVVEEQMVSSDTVELSLDEPSEELAPGTVLEADLVIQDTVDNAILLTDIVDEPDAVDEKAAADLEKGNQVFTASPDSAIIETKVMGEAAVSQSGVLDPNLNVFAVGNIRSTKTPGNKLVGVIFIIVFLFLIVFGWLYFSETTTTAHSEQLLEGDPLIQERIEAEKAKAIEQTAAQTLPPKAKEVEQNEVRAAEARAHIGSLEKTAGPEAVVGIKIKKRIISRGLYKELNVAYNAMEKGKFEYAKTSYQRALSARPTSIDALLGLANIESREGNVLRARELYEQVLIQQETNTTAHIGLLHTYSDDAPLAKQQILEGLSSKYPENPEVLMALGQFYSSQSKWLKAQDAYFRGFAVQPSSVTFAYNLGVSLDQLGKVSAAKMYYQKAISLNRLSINPIDMAAISMRLNELEVAKSE